MKNPKKNSRLNDFIYSFKPKIIWVYIILFDLLFYGVSILMLKGIGSFLNNKFSAVSLPEGDMFSMTEEQLAPIAAQLQNILISLIVGVLITIIVILAAWSLSKGLIYTLILKKKLTRQYFKKFFLLNLFLGSILFVILTFVTAIGTVFSGLFPFKYIFYVVLLAAAYHLSLNYMFFTKNNKVFESIGKALVFGTKKLFKLIIPCILIFIIFQIIVIVLGAIPIPLYYRPFASLIIFAIFMAWARIYFVQEAEKIK